MEAAGGRVIDWDGLRVLGVLATSRSIGNPPRVLERGERNREREIRGYLFFIWVLFKWVQEIII